MSFARRPNTVMILSDDHVSHAISAYGSVVNVTPRIGEIGELGVRVENCFAPNSSCSPSRASILTGAYSHVNGVTTPVMPIDTRQPTIISRLRESGCRTAMVGKWHMGQGEGSAPENYDYWDVLTGSPGRGVYWNPEFTSKAGTRIVEGHATDRRARSTRSRCPRPITRAGSPSPRTSVDSMQASNALDNRGGNKPAAWSTEVAHLCAPARSSHGCLAACSEWVNPPPTASARTTTGRCTR